MKRVNRINSSGIFLLELIFAILFFAIASSVCLRFFVKANRMSTEAAELNHACVECANAAELAAAVQSPDEFFELVKTAYPHAEISGGTITLSYDGDFNPCVGDGEYTMLITVQSAEGGISSNISFFSDNREIYELSVFGHIPGRAQG